MSILSRLFGGGSQKDPKPKQEPELYKGYDIHAAPVRDGTHWRVAARIEREVGGEVKSHQLIRADTIADRETAVRESLRKAKQLIDEQGDAIFNRRR